MVRLFDRHSGINYRLKFWYIIHDMEIGFYRKSLKTEELIDIYEVRFCIKSTDGKGTWELIKQLYKKEITHKKSKRREMISNGYNKL